MVPFGSLPSFYHQCVMSLLSSHLLTNLMRAAPFQPATNLWRAVELPFFD